LDGSFDYILCADVLEHLREPERLLRACRERLAPEGALIASLPNSGHAYFRGHVLMGRFPQHDRGLFDRTHLRFCTWHGWVDLLARAGFLIEELHCSGVPVGLALPKWEDSLWVRALERLSYESAQAWKSLFAYQFIVRARAERLT
jgi:SAM-dependent methyltransferase